jgi:hypothetical protein
MKGRRRDLFDKSHQQIYSVEASTVDINRSAASALFGFLGRAAITVVLCYPPIRSLFVFSCCPVQCTVGRVFLEIGGHASPWKLRGFCGDNGSAEKVNSELG